MVNKLSDTLLSKQLQTFMGELLKIQKILLIQKRLMRDERQSEMFVQTLFFQKYLYFKLRKQL